MDTLAMPEVISFLEARIDEAEAAMDPSALPLMLILEAYQRPPKVLKGGYRVTERRTLGFALLAHTINYADHPDFQSAWGHAVQPDIYG